MLKSIYLELLNNVLSVSVLKSSTNNFFKPTESCTISIDKDMDKGELSKLEEEIKECDEKGFSCSSAAPITKKLKTSFAGMDVISVVNNEPLTSVTSIKYVQINDLMAKELISQSEYYDKNLLKEYTVALELQHVIFDDMINIKDGDNLIVIMCDESGRGQYKVFNDIKIYNNSSILDTDSILLKYKQVLLAKSCTEFMSIDHLKSTRLINDKYKELKSQSKIITKSSSENPLELIYFCINILNKKINNDFIATVYISNELSKNGFNKVQTYTNIKDDKISEFIIEYDNNYYCIKKATYEAESTAKLIEKDYRKYGIKLTISNSDLLELLKLKGDIINVTYNSFFKEVDLFIKGSKEDGYPVVKEGHYPPSASMILKRDKNNNITPCGIELF